MNFRYTNFMYIIFFFLLNYLLLFKLLIRVHLSKTSILYTMINESKIRYIRFEMKNSLSNIQLKTDLYKIIFSYPYCLIK